MSVLSRGNWRKWLFVPLILAGVLLFFTVIKNRKGLEPVEASEEVRAVRTILVQPLDLVPRALGYGIVEPGKTWKAVAEVAGKVVEVHPRLEHGAILPSGTTLFRIDSSPYELAVARRKADLTNLTAKLDRLDVSEANSRELLEIEKESLAVNQKELERIDGLLKAGARSEAEYNAMERQILGQRRRVLEIENSLRLVPTDRRELEAQRAATQAELEQAQLDLEHTTIRAPFDCRIESREVELAQAVAAGQVLAQVDGIDLAEIQAQIPLSRMRNLVRSDSGATFPSDVGAFDFPSLLDFEATVRLEAGGERLDWAARFDRVSALIDPQTRTVGVIAAVDEPYRNASIGVRPPLVKGMYCEVEIRAPTRENTLVVPSYAVHGKTVYLVDDSNRLLRREIDPQFAQGDLVVVQDGLEGGESLVVSDLIPAIEGMLLEPQREEELERRLAAKAEGRDELR